MNAEPVTDVTQLYGVGDLADALRVPHGYVTPLLNTGVFCHTHRWGGFRLFTRDRMEEIVREHGALIRTASLLTSIGRQADEAAQPAESMSNEA